MAPHCPPQGSPGWESASRAGAWLLPRSFPSNVLSGFGVLANLSGKAWCLHVVLTCFTVSKVARLSCVCGIRISFALSCWFILSRRWSVRNRERPPLSAPGFCRPAICLGTLPPLLWERVDHAFLSWCLGFVIVRKSFSILRSLFPVGVFLILSFNIKFLNL